MIINTNSIQQVKRGKRGKGVIRLLYGLSYGWNCESTLRPVHTDSGSPIYEFMVEHG